MADVRTDRLRLQLTLLEAEVASDERREVEVTCVRPGLSRRCRTAWWASMPW